MTLASRDRLDELECRDTSWLRAHRSELVREQRRLHAEELVVVAILDRRGALDASMAAADGVSAKTARDTLETARRLESLPHIAAAAADGRLSDEQLAPLVELADESTDAEWAQRAPNVSPVDLKRMARTQAKPTVEESQRRQQARSLRMWWDESHSMLSVRGELPDLMGAEFEATINELVDKLSPVRGQAWDTRAHRGADALLAMSRTARRRKGDREDSCDEHVPTLAPKPVLVLQVPLQGPATVAGIPLPDARVEQLRASATIELVLVDETGEPVAVGRRFSALSDKIIRSVLLRDGHCRMPGCDIRHGLQIHHLVPCSWGGTDQISDLAAVCTIAHHHEQLIPHGPLALVGNPNQPDGLRLVRYDQLTDEEARHYGLPPPRRSRE
jgi:hypothetical protein